ncbi:helix-turn-helix domain-containing protein [Nocardiopsis sp. NPDC058789]|uniref:helix-turn-helix domain-containing protein n=1 Tax=Nocardiopsis sp. NPDC058789 TaxID=3346634 RepID=UPI0036724E07
MSQEADTDGSGSDLGRRAATRRRELGLTREEVARLAGMDPGYVAYLEEHASRMTRPTLDHLAGALDTTQDHLLGADTDLPPGTATTAAPVATTTSLPPSRCMRLIGPGGVGRIGLRSDSEPAPVILPVNFLVRDGAIVFRTAVHGLIAGNLPDEVAFEVDRVDAATSEGWSVLVVGRAEPVTEEAETARLRQSAPLRPWAGGEHDLYVRVTPRDVSGRRVGGRALH